MSNSIFLLTPPFTQLNTPYPATCYLKGFLNTKHISCFQADLGIDVTLELFTKKSFETIFNSVNTELIFSENAMRILSLKEKYVATIDAVITFLQGKNSTLAMRILQDGFLPKAARFNNFIDDEWAFGNNGLQDKAKHFATLYLEDIADFIKECIDENFGFSRYAEQLGRSANSFDELYNALQKSLSFIDEITISILSKKIKKVHPNLIAISIPFPGNLFSAFRCAQWIKKNYPTIKIVFGGGFPNTELREIKDVRVFEFIDFITLDDGETPLENLWEYINGKRPIELLKRTFVLQNNQVIFINGSLQRDYKQQELGIPDYSDLPLHDYISVIEIINPMHRLWSDGRWNKLTLAHGCYWAKCTFCDVSLDYISNYQVSSANIICDKIEHIINQTGSTGFHFVDEAAPPAMMRDIALEIIRRKLIITWWTNIRFEKSFTNDLCYLLQESGCIAVSGGLEVASDRLLTLIDKGVSIEQVSLVLKNFKQNNIMVHAYLMYGFPTETAQETIDSLEIVRQLFKNNILQSGFWHHFALTTHSPITKNATAFSIKIKSKQGDFANNDLEYEEIKGINHEQFSFGLKKSLYNYMQHHCIDDSLQTFFEHKIPSTNIEKNYIETILNEVIIKKIKPTTKIYWIGAQPSISFVTKSKKGNTWQMADLVFQNTIHILHINVTEEEGKWLLKMFLLLDIHQLKTITYQELQTNYENEIMQGDFELFWYNKILKTLDGKGLIHI